MRVVSSRIVTISDNVTLSCQLARTQLAEVDDTMNSLEGSPSVAYIVQYTQITREKVSAEFMGGGCQYDVGGIIEIAM